jgi:large subunit ribosomal protein L13
MMTVDKTFVLKGTPPADWLLVDANEGNLGRLASLIAYYLLGKHKPTFTASQPMGDFVVVINAGKLRLTPKRMDNKFYYRHSHYPGGLTETSLRDQMKNHPDRVIRSAVWGMLPHNKVGRQLIKRLKIFADSEHTHAAQNPQPVAERSI